MQWRMLGRRGRQASWTIVGDAAQSAWPDLAEARRAREEALRGKQMRRFHLTTNYRNSAEIFEFAADIVRRAVPDADLPDGGPADRSPCRSTASARPATWPAAVTAAVAELLDAVDGTVGVIVPAARRRRGAGWLVDGWTSRVQVVDGMRAKGMEYDGVWSSRPDEIEAESPAGIRVLYVALTRATHRLITLSIGTPPAKPRRRRRGAKSDVPGGAGSRPPVTCFMQRGASAGDRFVVPDIASESVPRLG